MKIDIRPLEHAELQARLDNVICNLIRMHVGKPCPTRREIMWVSMLPRRQVWVYLREMQERGLIEIEVCGKADPKRRRMRIVGGRWTLWTARPPIDSDTANAKRWGGAPVGTRHQ